MSLAITNPSRRPFNISGKTGRLKEEGGPSHVGLLRLPTRPRTSQWAVRHKAMGRYWSTEAGSSVLAMVQLQKITLKGKTKLPLH